MKVIAARSRMDLVQVLGSREMTKLLGLRGDFERGILAVEPAA